jgi:hypothetical protein
MSTIGLKPVCPIGSGGIAAVGSTAGVEFVAGAGFGSGGGVGISVSATIICLNFALVVARSNGIYFFVTIASSVLAIVVSVAMLLITLGFSY